MTTTDVQVKFITNQGLYHGWLDGSTDGTETNTQIRDISGALRDVGDHLQGQTLLGFDVQLSDGSILTTAKLYSKSAGIVGSWRGNERTAHDMLCNLRVRGLSILIEKGMLFKTNCAD